MANLSGTGVFGVLGVAPGTESIFGFRVSESVDLGVQGAASNQRGLVHERLWSNTASPQAVNANRERPQGRAQRRTGRGGGAGHGRSGSWSRGAELGQSQLEQRAWRGCTRDWPEEAGDAGTMGGACGEGGERLW